MLEVQITTTTTTNLPDLHIAAFGSLTWRLTFTDKKLLWQIVVIKSGKQLILLSSSRYNSITADANDSQDTVA